jgi:hypothetical protein
MALIYDKLNGRLCFEQKETQFIQKIIFKIENIQSPVIL